MERKEEKGKAPMQNLTFSEHEMMNHIPATNYDGATIFESVEKVTNQFGGFSDLLNIQDFNASNSLYDMFKSHNPISQQQQKQEQNDKLHPYSSQAQLDQQFQFQQQHALSLPAGDSYEVPVTPWDLSSSHEVDNEKKVQADVADDKLLKPKKRRQIKKKKEDARTVFMTNSKTDHIDDGYKWRKYGKKTINHNSFPRSYYRCTSLECGVKKHVERSIDDPTVVVTTYKGKHNHPIIEDFPVGYESTRSTNSPFSSSFSSILQQQQQPYTYGLVTQPMDTNSSASYFSSGYVEDMQFGVSSSNEIIRGQGLLQDILPSGIWNEPSKDA